MKKKISVLLILAAFSAVFLFAKKMRYKYISGNASWMSIINLKNPEVNYYFDIDIDGNVIYRFKNKNLIFTKTLKIDRQLAKDFFREAKIAKNLISNSDSQKKLLFYRGNVLEISLYLEGALRRVKSPLVNFGEAFLYAFKQIKEKVKKAPLDVNITAFLTASPMNEKDMDRFYAEAGKDYEFPLIETMQLKRNKKLLGAIKQPYRLLPLKSEEEIKGIDRFIKKHKIYGLKNLFYIYTTRGIFKCEIIPSRKLSKKRKKFDYGKNNK